MPMLRLMRFVICKVNGAKMPQSHWEVMMVLPFGLTASWCIKRRCSWGSRRYGRIPSASQKGEESAADQNYAKQFRLGVCLSVSIIGGRSIVNARWRNTSSKRCCPSPKGQSSFRHGVERSNRAVQTQASAVYSYIQTWQYLSARV